MSDVDKFSIKFVFHTSHSAACTNVGRCHEGKGVVIVIKNKLDIIAMNVYE